MRRKDHDSTYTTNDLNLSLRRRDFMAAGAAVLATGIAGPAIAAPDTERAQPGDGLVITDGEHKDKRATLDLIPVSGAPLKALPVDPATGKARSRSRFNKLLLVRVPAEKLDEETSAHAAEGVLAYSAICTHQGCEVSAWIEDKQLMACFCHHSEFDPADSGRVVSGPAKARLPILPLTLAEGELRVAADFTAKPGPKR